MDSRTGTSMACGGSGRLNRCLSPELFKALGDPRRAAILVHLAQAGAPLTVGEIAACCPTDTSVVSRHLAVLREAGVLDAEKRGRELYHRVRFAELAGLLRELATAIEECCAGPDEAQRVEPAVRSAAG